MWKTNDKDAKKFVNNLGFEIKNYGMFSDKPKDWSAFKEDLMVYYDEWRQHLEFYITSNGNEWEHVATYHYDINKLNIVDKSSVGKFSEFSF